MLVADLSLSSISRDLPAVLYCSSDPVLASVSASLAHFSVFFRIAWSYGSILLGVDKVGSDLPSSSLSLLLSVEEAESDSEA